MSIRVNIGMAGVALQKDDHTRAAAPAYVHGLTGGSPFGITREASSTSVACGTRADTDGYVSSIEANPNFNTLGYADVIALYYYAALGNIVSSAATAADMPAGASPDGYFKHVITMGRALPNLTVWGQVGSDNYGVTEGCKLNNLGCEFTGNEPLAFSVEAIGKDAEFLDADPFTGKDPSCFNGYFVPTDGTFQLDTAGSTPEDAVVMSGSVTIGNDCEGSRACGKVFAAEVGEGKCSVSPSFTVVPDNILPYRKMVTGSETGLRPVARIVYGSYHLAFSHSEDPNCTLQFDGDRVPFSADFVEVDPDGRSGEFTFQSDASYVASKDASPVKVTIVNKVASYPLPTA